MDRKRKERHVHTVRLPSLPEHLVEKIVALIPFPDISKEWKSKFPSVARQDFFRWPQYLARKSGNEVVAYDEVLGCVRRITVDIPIVTESDEIGEDNCGSLAVAVRCYRCADEEAAWITSPKVTVTNILTRKRKRMSCPITVPVEVLQVNLFPVGTDHYSIIICYADSRARFDLTEYNSRSGRWKTQHQRISGFQFRSVYKDGSWYYLDHFGGARGGEPLSFVRSNIQTGVKTETPIPVKGKLLFDYVLRCGSDVIAVVMDSRTRSLIVLQLDTKSSALVEVSRTPVREEDVPRLCHGRTFCIGSSNRIYLPLSRYDDPNVFLVYVYDVSSKTWSRSYVPAEFSMDRRSLASYYRPYVLDLGLNPFVVP